MLECDWGRKRLDDGGGGLVRMEGNVKTEGVDGGKSAFLKGGHK